MREAEKDRIVTVCDKCLTACCWHGELMCDDAKESGTIDKTVEELDRLNREHPSHYSIEKIRRVCG
jgi:epoxyqueuosine reductase QueG